MPAIREVGKQTLEIFCKKSNIAGFSYTVDYHFPKWIRFIWIIILTALVTFMLVACGILTSDVFISKNVYTTMTMETNDSLAFPVIHICEPSFYSRQKLSG